MDHPYSSSGRSRRFDPTTAPDALNAMIPASTRPLKSWVVATNAVPSSSHVAAYGTAVAFENAAQRTVPFGSLAKSPPAGGDHLVAHVTIPGAATGSTAIA